MAKFKIVAKVVHSPWDLADSGWDRVRVRDSSGLGQPEVGGPSLQMGAEVGPLGIRSQQGSNPQRGGIRETDGHSNGSADLGSLEELLILNSSWDGTSRTTASAMVKSHIALCTLGSQEVSCTP